MKIRYIIQLADDAPSGDITPFITSIKGNGDWEWMRLNVGATKAYQFRCIVSAKKWAESKKWVRQWRYCINEVKAGNLGGIVYSSTYD